MKKLILTVCNGNIHRSVIAALCIEKQFRTRGLEDEYAALSRGLQGSCGTTTPRFPNLRCYKDPEWKYSQPVLERLGIDLPENQEATPIDLVVVERAALILVLDCDVLSRQPQKQPEKSPGLVQQFPEHGFKMRLYRELCGEVGDFHDCFGEHDPERHREVIEEIHSIACERFETIVKLADFFSAYRKEK